MLTSTASWESNTLSSLPQVKFDELSPALQQVLDNASASDKVLMTRIVAIASVELRSGISSISAEHLCDQRVLYPVARYCRANRGVRTQVRELYCLLGYENILPSLSRVYPQYHPEITSWLRSEDIEGKRLVDMRASCMYFLTWFCEHILIAYAPHQVPTKYLQRKHLLDYRHHLLKSVEHGERSKSTAKWHLQQVVRWTKWLIDERRIGDIDYSGIGIKPSESRVRRIPTHLEISRFMESLMEVAPCESYIIALLLLLSTGARPVEIERLTYECIDFEKQVIRLQSKGGPERRVPVPDNVWALLTAYLKSEGRAQTDSNPYVLRGKKGHRLHTRTTHSVFANAESASGVDIDGLKALRHRFATDCYESKVPPTVFQYVMGHQDLSQMMRYQHENESFDRKHVQTALSQWMGKWS